MKLCRLSSPVALALLCAVTCTGLGQADAAPGSAPALSPLGVTGPVAPAFDVPDAAALPVFAAAPVDRAKAASEDAAARANDEPPRFALPQAVVLTPENAGAWHDLDERWTLWRLRIAAEGALSLNLGFDRYRLPKNSRLSVYAADAVNADDPRGVRVFTERDNSAHGQLWTPVVVADDIVVELLLPRISRHDYELELTRINRGYDLFGVDKAAFGDKSGSCNVDVVCPEGDPWRTEITSVGVYTVNGIWKCSGAMINNTAMDETPYFLTANHCGVNASTDQSVVVYWNFESPACGQQGGGQLNQYNSGVIFRAAYAGSDYCLVELEEPLNPDHHVAYAGWDRSGADLERAVAIHHPSTDEKSISFENDPTTTTNYLGTAVPGDGTHIRVEDWDLGTTEGGSSGSPLFDSAHHIVGQLHGGDAACDNNESDWYGKLSVSWVNGLAAYLDPLGTAPMTLRTLAPWAQGIAVEGGNLSAGGATGGPFSPAGATWTVTNVGDAALLFEATTVVPWLDVDWADDVLQPGASTEVQVAFNGAAGLLSPGRYTGVLNFVNRSGGEGNATRDLALQVGVQDMIYRFDLAADPGWTADEGWAYGAPLGQGGVQHGNADPTAGYTGPNVYGYNLAGDYEANLPERHLTTAAIDCSNLTGVEVRFQRWLNVEQPQYDRAALSVSNDAVNWTQVWSNGVEITDNAWRAVAYDISAVADTQATVYLRWTMGTTDVDWQYSGWNIDDVEIWGLTNWATAVQTPPAAAPTVGNHPNPFNPATTLSFALDRAGAVQLDVYDMQGRLVRRLLDGNLAAGEHAVVWGGRDAAGRQAGSGVYLARLSAGGTTVQHKMVMLK